MIRSGPAPPGWFSALFGLQASSSIQLPQHFCHPSASPASCSLSPPLFLWAEHQAGAAQEGGLGRADQAGSGGRVPFSCQG